MNVTLDGFMATSNGGLDWHFPHWSDEMSRYADQQLSRIDTVLLGRVTYEAMAGYYQSVESNYAATAEDAAYAFMMNNYNKIVFSKTLSTVDWKNTRLIRENIAAEVMQLKQQPGRDLVILGSGSIVTVFMELGLIDEYLVWVYPVILGEGMPFLHGLHDKLDLKLLKTKRFRSGVVVLYYQALYSCSNK
ncbi:putative protein YyaP [Chitinophaga sp. MM2321]